MSSALENLEYYVDPPWERVSLAWLLNYVQRIRANPILSKAISADKEKFEMVPMPKEVVKQLASKQLAAPILEPLKESKAARENGPVMTVIQKFSRALEAGKVEDAMALISSSYHDANGRDAVHFRDFLRKWSGITTFLRIVLPPQLESQFAVGEFLVANIQLTWEATINEGSRREHKSSPVRVELILKSSGKEGWKIVGIRTI
ncbi:MAG: hypothetical protein ABSD57_14700 [Verrucomicrobiota bacterium]|jgi:hypothetical protein